jgi:hypothetical protein
VLFHREIISGHAYLIFLLHVLLTDEFTMTTQCSGCWTALSQVDPLARDATFEGEFRRDPLQGLQSLAAETENFARPAEESAPACTRSASASSPARTRRSPGETRR